MKAGWPIAAAEMSPGVDCYTLSCHRGPTPQFLFNTELHFRLCGVLSRSDGNISLADADSHNVPIVSVMTGTATQLVQKGDFLHFKLQLLVHRKGGGGVNAPNKFHYISHPISKPSTFPLGSSGT